MSLYGALMAAVAGRRKNAGGGGPTTSPTFHAVGTGSNATSGTATPTYPTNTSGDLYILQTLQINGTANTPAGWTLQSTKVNGVWTQQVFTRDTRASGSDSGTINVTQSGSTLILTQIFSFSNVATSSFIEGLVTVSATDGTCPGPSVTSTAAHRLACCFMSSNSNAGDLGPITGMSGGTWAEAAAEWTSGVGGEMGCDTADLAAAGTISGGSASVGGSNSTGIAFALVGV